MRDDGLFIESHNEPWHWTRTDVRRLLEVGAFLVAGNYLLFFTDLGEWIRCHQSVLQWIGWDPTIPSC